MVASASAKLPEWGQCVATEGGTGGKYTDSACLDKAHSTRNGEERLYGGAFEWVPAEEEFASKSKSGLTLNGTFAFETQQGAKIECTGITKGSGMTFVLNGATTPRWNLTGCRANGGQEECATISAGSFKEEISSLLEARESEVRGWNHPSRLGFLERGSEPLVGLGFKEAYNPEPGVEAGEPFFSPISCGPSLQEEEEGVMPAENSLGTVKIGGNRKGGNGVIGALAPVNVMSSHYTLTYSENSAGIQSTTRFAHQKPQVLDAFIRNAWEPVALVGQFKIEFALGWEIRASH